MRSLEECKKEIYLRSEKRIKQRRQRRTRVLGLSVSLCLCLTLVLAIPALSGSGLREKISPMENAQMAQGPGNMPYMSAEIRCITPRNEEAVLTVTREETRCLYSAIQDLYTHAETAPEIGDGNTAAGHSDSAPTYYLTFLSQDHQNVLYRLTEDMLINETDGSKIPITREQFEKLRHFLETLGA